MTAKDRLFNNLRAALPAALIVLLVPAIGCMVPKAKYAALETQSRALLEQNRAQLAEIENLNVHARNTEDQLRRTEENLAMLEETETLDRSRLENYKAEREEMQRQFSGLTAGRGHLSPDVSDRLVEISRRYPSLVFDPQTGIAKLDTDILFDSGYDELKPGADELLSELAAALQTPQTADLKLMVVGHTDDHRMAKRPARDKFPTNFHLSTARAVAVAKTLTRHGISSDRMGVAGFAEHQPIAPNVSPADRRKNRRVELFVLAPNVPVIGWTETIPSVY
ncbi:MAG: OmpA family protein [Planctomycetota bacterium]|nr:OmpA family protein [Planctomycetota bacterium]